VGPTVSGWWVIHMRLAASPGPMCSATNRGRLASLAMPEVRQAAMRGTVEAWATESLLAAREAYKVPEAGLRLKSGQKLSDAYLDANLPVVRRRLYQASVRLATVRNDSW
jgi:nuclease S1